MDPAEHGPRGDLNPADLERRLAHLRPAAGGLGRDRMLYEAGRAAARADSRAGLASAAALALAIGCVGLGGLLARERGHRLDLERALAAARPAEPEPRRLDPPPVPALAVRPGPDSYLALTRRALVAGLADPPAPHEARRGGPPIAPEPPLRVRSTGAAIDL